MQTIKITGEVDADHRLIATVPDSIAPGKVEIVVLARIGDEDDAGVHWMAGVAREWQAELNDPREDIYSITDGVAVDGSR